MYKRSSVRDQIVSRIDPRGVVFGVHEGKVDTSFVWSDLADYPTKMCLEPPSPAPFLRHLRVTMRGDLLDRNGIIIPVT
jgi:hypothetical protein